MGNPAMEVGLAAPATGPVASVWYSADGAQLFARTRTGQVLSTNDFESWVPVQGTPDPADPPAPAVDRLPEPGAKLAMAPPRPAASMLWARSSIGLTMAGTPGRI